MWVLSPWQRPPSGPNLHGTLPGEPDKGPSRHSAHPIFGGPTPQKRLPSAQWAKRKTLKVGGTDRPAGWSVVLTPR